MATPTPDPLAAALDQEGPRQGGAGHKLANVFRDRPQVLEAIIRARQQGKSFRLIAEVLSREGTTISEGAVQNWLRAQGVK